jgi:hypothetical protein
MKTGLARRRLVGDALRVNSENRGIRLTYAWHRHGHPQLIALALLLAGRFVAAATEESPPSTNTGSETSNKVTRVAKRTKPAARANKTKLQDAGSIDAASDASTNAPDAAIGSGHDPSELKLQDASVAVRETPPASSAAMVVDASAPAPASIAPPTKIEVRIRETVIFTLQLSDGGMSAVERAKRANRAIEQAIGGAAPKPVRVEQRGGRCIVFIGARPIVELTAEDAAIAGEGSLDLYAASVQARISDILHAEETRSQLGKTVRDVVIVIVLGLLALFSLKIIRDWSYRARAWVERNPQRIPAIRLKSIEVVRPPVLRNATLVSLAVLKWIGQIGAVYLWLIASMSFFESTRGYTEKLTGLVLSPLSTLTGRIAALLPLTMIVALGAVVLLILLRFISLFFAAVERGETKVEHLSPALAAPTSLVVRIGLVVLTLLVVAPVLTGNNDGTFSRLGQLAIAAIALALVPLITTVFLGMRVLYTSRLTVGQWVSIGSVTGRILELTLFDTRIWLSGGATARVPHLVLLWQTLRTSTGTTNRVRLSIATLEHLSETIDDLTSAAARFGSDASVNVESVAPNRADLLVQVTMPESMSRNALLIDLLRVLSDRNIPIAEGCQAETTP